MRKLVFPIVALILTAPVLAGVVYEIDVKDHEHSPPRAESIEVSSDGINLKMSIATGDEGFAGEMIFHGGDEPEMVVVDHDRKSYIVMGRKEIEAIAGQVNQAMAQMEEALKNVPEGQRGMIEKMMKERMPRQAPPRPETELRKTSERAEKNGYPCVKYEAHEDGDKVGEMWVTEWKNVEGSGEMEDVFGEMAEFFRDMLDTFSSMGAAHVGHGFENSFLAHMKDLGGFPVVARSFGGDGSLEDESALREARRQDFDPDAFEPPAGYERQEMSPGR